MTGHRPRRVVGIVALASLVLAPSILVHEGAARAQTSTQPRREETEADVEEARRHFTAAVELFHGGELEAALGEFRASYDLNPLPQVLYNIAVVQRDLQQLIEAIDTLHRYLEEGRDEPDRRRALARELLAELEGLLAAVRIVCDQDGADLYVDGELSGRTPIATPLRLLAGPHQLELRLDGFVTHRQSVELAGDRTVDLAVELDAVRPPWHRSWWFWTSVGGGVVLVTTIAVLAAVLSRPSDAEFTVSVVSAEAR